VAQLVWLPRRSGHKNASQKDVALTRFIQFLVNPLAPTLGGPLRAFWEVLRQEHQTPENILLAWVRNRRYGFNGHSEEETGGIFQEAHDRPRSDSTMEQKRLSLNVLEEMGKCTDRERDYTAVADPSRQFGETSCSRPSQTRSVVTSIWPANGPPTSPDPAVCRTAVRWNVSGRSHLQCWRWGNRRSQRETSSEPESGPLHPPLTTRCQRGSYNRRFE